MSRKYLIETFGCQMNYHDSERMAGLLEAAGYERPPTTRDADVIVINTCSVREQAEEKLYTRLGEFRELGREHGHDPIVAVAGCVAQQEGAALLEALRAGRRGRRHAPGAAAADAARAGRRTPVTLQIDLGAARRRGVSVRRDARGDPVRAWVTIIEGCNEYCSFCVVPYTRGQERMRPKAEILAEVRAAAASGQREVQLLGQIVNHYQAPDDAACDFAGCWRRSTRSPGVERIRFASPHPRHVSDAADRRHPRPAEGLQAPAPAGAVRIHACCSARCAGATPASRISRSSSACERRSRASRYPPT